MKRSTIIISVFAVLTALVALSGCASSEPRYVLSAADPQPSTLLFDREGVYPDGGDVVWQAGWPSADSLYRAPEVITYRERLIDYQGPWFGRNNYTYRRFDMRTSGQAVR